MVEVWLNTLFILFILGAITTLANLCEQENRLRYALFFVLMGFNALLLVYPFLADFSQTAEAQETPETGETAREDISTAALVSAIFISLTGAGLVTLFLWQPIRTWAGRFFPQGTRPPPPSEMPLTPLIYNGQLEFHLQAPPALPATPGFRPDSMVHLWAFALTIYFVCSQLSSFFLLGGMEGVAESIAVDYSSLIANFLPQVLIPLLGVGLFIRRNPRQILDRLGLKRPSLLGMAVSVFTAGGLVFMGIVVSVIWVLLAGEATVEEQSKASEALAESINTLGLAFMVAFTAGVGEEIAFRGALQPIFGFWFTAVTFVLAHTQYTLTPASLIILAVAVAFGLIRKYLDTTSAIFTHFFYNFTLLLLSLAAQQVEPSWLHIFQFLR